MCDRFSALQRAEIAEILKCSQHQFRCARFSALQRAEIAEILKLVHRTASILIGFSALQRAEIAEIETVLAALRGLFGFSALQRAEIAEIVGARPDRTLPLVFQCSSTSRNC